MWRRNTHYHHIPYVRFLITVDAWESSVGWLIRSRCWNGKDLDSPNHKEHVAYPSSGSFESGGPCPATHPVKLPQLMYEVMWDTTVFNDKNIWPTDGSQPFVYSMGDGYVSIIVIDLLSTDLIGLVTASTATTSSVGKTASCKKRSMLAAVATPARPSKRKARPSRPNVPRLK